MVTVPILVRSLGSYIYFYSHCTFWACRTNGTGRFPSTGAMHSQRLQSLGWWYTCQAAVINDLSNWHRHSCTRMVSVSYSYFCLQSMTFNLLASSWQLHARHAQLSRKGVFTHIGSFSHYQVEFPADSHSVHVFYSLYIYVHVDIIHNVHACTSSMGFCSHLSGSNLSRPGLSYPWVNPMFWPATSVCGRGYWEHSLRMQSSTSRSSSYSSASLSILLWSRSSLLCRLILCVSVYVCVWLSLRQTVTYYTYMYVVTKVPTERFEVAKFQFAT